MPIPITITAKIVNNTQHVNIAHTVHSDILKKKRFFSRFTYFTNTTYYFQVYTEFLGDKS